MSKFLRVTTKEGPKCSRIERFFLCVLMGLFLTTGISPAIALNVDTVYANGNLPEDEPENTRISGERLMKMHPTNLLKALQLLEPSLVINERNRDQGGDPNFVLSSLTLTGPRTFGSNTSASKDVLVIVDGYEISLQRLADFDVTRVESVRILKDTKSSVRYGMRGTNGIIEITTRLPESGAIRLNYRFDGGIEIADRTYFDLMNAGQKLVLEKELGLYEGIDALYQERLQNGNADWLDIPLRTSFRHTYRLSMEGGDTSLRVMADLIVEPGNEGVMRGSKRSRYGAIGALYYDLERLCVSNQISAELVKGRLSDYGNLYDYIVINPYYTPQDNLSLLGENTFNQQYSPLYEASLSSFSKNKFIRFNNNLTARFEINEKFALSGNFAFTKDYAKYDQFISPSSNIFNIDRENADLVGSYEIRRDNKTVYEENLALTFKEQWGIHNLEAVIGAHSYASTIYADNFEAMGMPNDNMSYVSFAKRYNYARRPGGREYRERLFGGYLMAAYDYDNRYGVQAALRLDRSAELAPDKKLAPSWSLSADWKLHNEKWLSENDVVNRLSLNVSAGQLAASQMSYNMVNPVYYYSFNDYYVNAATLNGFALVSLMQDMTHNGSLKWRTDTRVDARLSLLLWNRISGDVGYYNVRSSDIAVLRKNDPVAGNLYSWVNDGTIRNQGVQFSLSAAIVRTGGLNLNLKLAGIANENKIVSSPEYEYVPNVDLSGFDPNRIFEGKTADEIFAYTSNGVDSQTGLSKVAADSFAPRGSATPKLSGNAGVDGTAGKWNFGFMLTYSLGGKVFDYYTYSFIDLAGAGVNGPVKMQDKWRKPGDTTPYQGFENPNNLPDTRFVKTMNTLSLGAVYVGYNLDSAIAERIYLKGLNLGLTLNDMLYVSSTKTPRGLLYPYARSFMLSVKATF